MKTEHNHFYTLTSYSSRESVLAISAWDYSAGKKELSEILSQDLPAKKFVVGSSIWSMKDSEQICQALQNNPLCRLQISWGAEFYRHTKKVLSFLENSGRVDVLIDRPLDRESVGEISVLCQSFNVRLCLVVNRYFSVTDTVKSLGGELRSHLVLNFPPPSGKKSPFYSPDEVIKIMDDLAVEGDFGAVIFDNILTSNTDIVDSKFYLHLNREDYFSGSMLLDQCRALRIVIFWMIRKKLVLLLDALYAVLVFLQNPSWQKAASPWRQLWNYLSMNIKKGANAAYCIVRYNLFHFFRYDVYHFFRYKVLHFVVATAYPFFRYRVPHYVRIGWDRVTLFLMLFFRYRVPHYVRIGWDRVTLFLMLFFRYRVPHFFRTYSQFIFYPIFKLYWFSSYQFQKRVLPYWRKRFREE